MHDWSMPNTAGSEAPSPYPTPMDRYLPMAGRADRLSANIPGDFTSMGSNADHIISSGGSN